MWFGFVRRRAGGCLGDEQHPGQAAAAHGRRGGRDDLLQPGVQPPGGNALVPRLERGFHCGNELVDRAPGVRNVVVSESLARRLVGEGDPTGTRLGANTVIGVAGDVRNAGLDRPSEVEFYQVRKATREGIAGGEDFAWWRRATAIVRSNLGERDAAESLRAAIRQVDPAVPIKLETMEARVDTFLTRASTTSRIFSPLAYPPAPMASAIATRISSPMT